MKIWNFLALIVSAIALLAISLWMGQQAYSWFPPQAAAESHLIDELFSFLVVLGTFIFLGVTGTLAYSIIFHRAAIDDTSDGPPIEGNITLEVVWTAIPILLVVWIATYSYQVYDKMSIRGPMEMVHLHMPQVIEPASAAPWNWSSKPTEPQIDSDEPIKVIAKQWAWVFQYPYKAVTSTELHLPVNQRVHLALESADVLHGFYIPAFRLKQDIIPKQTIDFEFTPIREGKYNLTDSQFSGTYFAAMTANVVVESLDNYKTWLVKAADQKPSPAPNQASAEYTKESQKTYKNGYPTVVPAPPQIVNYPG
jgi:cytochrome c oxidase subunit II